ncbi:hypothetical protein PC119_g9032 [Phytophthora cactorum]|uniref:Uncharacterized protein n=1 Tax=Phytophthora cactorum TaxID=29920 RepID=A0A8T1EM69_9STRA|nr:hypothetical protein PC114_g1585 [Phytophthora cactorum]KAG2954662.1 hypothetical protein PC117_g1015 [Phytophthora cactorum]KAG3016030.1 hypothetical protein PC120_g11858 [Phytophthora cactorum]KAG3023111.1 hypothetical protein PC119_g9032 [Phytophthora cactorum]KAG3184648.1 hypothetical protein PC128_g13644 [Phytophthora cactorum]
MQYPGVWLRTQGEGPTTDKTSKLTHTQVTGAVATGDGGAAKANIMQANNEQSRLLRSGDGGFKLLNEDGSRLGDD